MTQESRRSDDNLLGKISKVWPLILSLSAIIGGAYVLHDNVSVLQTTSKSQGERIEDHEKRLIRVEEGVAALAEMRQEVKEINQNLLRMLSKRDR